MLSKIKKNYFLITSSFLILYFFFNLLDGDRGLFSYLDKKKLLENLIIQENDLKKRINELNFKNSLLTDNLDVDYIETIIRKKFLLKKDKEVLYMIKNKDE